VLAASAPRDDVDERERRARPRGNLRRAFDRVIRCGAEIDRRDDRRIGGRRIHVSNRDNEHRLSRFHGDLLGDRLLPQPLHPRSLMRTDHDEIGTS
jgi:hypothetical protein